MSELWEKALRIKIMDEDQECHDRVMGYVITGAIIVRASLRAGE